MKWYCVFTHPFKEVLVTGYISQTLGLECYHPTFKQRVIIRRIKREIVRPLFPRYIFCHFNLAISYRSVRYASDVVDVVSVGREPIEVADNIISTLRRRELTAISEAEGDFSTLPSPGSKVEITGGVMRGLEGLFLRPMDDSERVAILLSTLNASVVVERSQCRVMQRPGTSSSLLSARRCLI